MNLPKLIINRSGPLQSSGGWIHIIPKCELANREAGIVQLLDDESLDSILANIEKDKNRLREQKKLEAQTRLNAFIARLLEMASAQTWSQRRLAAKIAIPETTFRRIRDGKVNPLAWLSKVEMALHRLKTEKIMGEPIKIVVTAQTAMVAHEGVRTPEQLLEFIRTIKPNGNQKNRALWRVPAESYTAFMEKRDSLKPK